MATEVLTQACSQCSQVKDLTTANFGVNTREATGFRTICKSCFSQNRSAKKTQAVRDLKNQERVVKAAKKALEHPEGLSMGQLHKAQQIVGLAEKKRGKLLAKIAEQRQAEEAAKFAQTANPSLARVQAQFGSTFFIPTAERGAVLEQLRTALATLTGPADGPARDYVQSNIAELTAMLARAAERSAFLAQQEQETANGRATQRAVGQIHDTYLPLIRAAKTASAKNALRMQLWKMKRAAQDVTTKSTEKDETGAQKSVVAFGLAKEFDKMARMLYGDTKPMAASDTLENVQSRIDSANAAQEWLEQAEADRQRYWDELRISDPKRFERESKSLILQTKGDDPLAQMARDAARKLKRENPEEYTRRALEALKPRKVTQDVVVWRVPTDAGTVLMWPNGREVRHGGDVQHAEIIKDARLGWVLNPSPMGAEIEDTASPVKKELIQDPMDCDAEGYPKWKWVPEGSTGIHEQQPDGSFKRTDNASPWGKATPIVFKDAEPPASPEHTVFKYGGWWTPAQVAAATSAEWIDTPPAVLPPLQRVVADSVAVEPPPTAAQLERMNRPAETVWERTIRERRQQAEREAALLRGTYVWNVS